MNKPQILLFALAIAGVVMDTAQRAYPPYGIGGGRARAALFCGGLMGDEGHVAPQRPRSSWLLLLLACMLWLAGLLVGIRTQKNGSCQPRHHLPKTFCWGYQLARFFMAPWWASTRTVVAIGRNYVAHAKELNNAGGR